VDVVTAGFGTSSACSQAIFERRRSHSPHPQAESASDIGSLDSSPRSTLCTKKRGSTTIAAKQQWRRVADQLRPKVPKLAALMDEAETDVLAYMSFPAQHRAKLHSTNPIERPIGEIKRRIEVVGIFPNEAAIVRLVGAILLEQNDEWAVQRARYITLESMSATSRSGRDPRATSAHVRIVCNVETPDVTTSAWRTKTMPSDRDVEQRHSPRGHSLLNAVLPPQANHRVTPFPLLRAATPQGKLCLSVRLRRSRGCLILKHE